MAAAPDSASQVAGRKLARPGPWSSIGGSDGLLWGECQGSGKTPYRVTVDTGTRRYQCSCPSRKFPCKHALALLFLRLPPNGKPLVVLPALLVQLLWLALVARRVRRAGLSWRDDAVAPSGSGG